MLCCLLVGKQANRQTTIYNGNETKVNEQKRRLQMTFSVLYFVLYIIQYIIQYTMTVFPRRILYRCAIWMFFFRRIIFGIEVFRIYKWCGGDDNDSTSSRKARFPIKKIHIFVDDKWSTNDSYDTGLHITIFNKILIITAIRTFSQTPNERQKI